MKDEFLEMCEEKLSEAKEALHKYGKDQGILCDMAIKTTNTILIQLNPTTEISSLFIIPALRHIADIFESNFPLSEGEKELIEFMYKELSETKNLIMEESW